MGAQFPKQLDPISLLVKTLNESDSMFGLSVQVAVVIGGNGGIIGRAVAVGLARAGASVAIFARNEEKNARVLHELEAIDPILHMGPPKMEPDID